MDLSITLARIIGPLLLLVAIGTLANRAHYRRMLAAFIEQPALYYFSGVLAFVIGAALVLHHNLWTADWRVIITLLGWASLIKGVARIVFPATGLRVAKAFAEKDWPLTWGAGAIGILGAALSHFGFAG